MFKVIENPEFKRQVTVSVPVDGGFENQTLSVRLRVLTQERISTLVDANPGNFRPLVEAMVVELGDLIDAEGNAVACNDAVRAMVLDMPFVRSAILRDYSEAVAGAKRGN